MNLLTFGKCRFPERRYYQVFILMFFAGLSWGIFYPATEVFAQIMYPGYVMHTHSSSQVADDLYAKGMELYNARKFDSSAARLNRAFKMYDTMGDTGNRLLALTQLTSVYAITQNVKMANGYIPLLLKAIDDTTGVDRRRIVYCTYEFANIYERIGEYKAGMRFIQRAIRLYSDSNLNDPWLLGRIYYVTGSLEDDFAFNDRAIKYVKKSLKLSLKTNDDLLATLKVDSYNSLGIFSYHEGKYNDAFNYLKKEVGIILTHPEWKYVSDKLLGGYINLGNARFFTGDYHTALSYYQKALRMVNQGVGKSASNKELILNNIGAAYSQMGDQKNALRYFLETLPLKIKKLGPNHPDVAVAYVNIGLTYQSLKKYNEAIEYLDKGLAIREKVFGKNNPNTLLVYNYLASVYKEQKKYNEALQYLKKTLSVYQTVFGLHHPETGKSLTGIGDVYRAMGDYHKALTNYQKALQALAPNFNSGRLADNPALNHILSEIEFESILERKASTLLEASRKNRKLVNSYIPIAIRTYSLTIRFIEKLRNSYQETSSKYLLNKNSYSIYSGAIEACMLGYKQLGDVKYRQKAFDFSEQSKAGVLMQSIEEARAQKYSGIPDGLLKEEKDLRQDIMQYTRDLDRATSDSKHIDSVKIGKLQDKLFTARQHLDTFITGLEKKYPSYYELKYRSPHLSIPDIRKKLNSSQAFLSYFVGDSTIYTFEITKNNFRVISNSIDSASFASNLSDFRRAIINGDWQSYTKLGYGLYKKLISPVQNDIRGKNLMIVPDPELSLVPFDALLTTPVNNVRPGDYADLPYLIRRYSITYGYSSYLIFRKRSKEVVHTSGFLGMAPVFDQSASTFSAYRRLTGSNNIPPLMSSLEEVKGIYSTVATNPVMKADSHIYLRDQATESKLKSPQVSHYRYIHLATHAYVDEKKPSLSGILFYPGTHTHNSGNDGILYTGEIYDLNLNARLVVLSACETANGQVIRGEGIIGFTRAFLYAGARNVVVSLWNVSDRSNPDLMIKFYHYLMKGDNVAHSLQLAKISMITERRYAMPAYWASMVQIR